MTGSYDPVLVALSYLIAAMASYVALELATRVSIAQGREAAYWLLGGAIAMGTGIWSMHFIGMLAFHLPIPTSYDIPVTLMSLLIAVLVSAVALFTFSRKTLGWIGLSTSGIFMGFGIAGMHYTGMDAMRMFPPIRYDVTYFALSIAIAIIASVAALRLGFSLRNRAGSRIARSVSALVMGLAITGMHYTGMVAANFDANSICLAGPERINKVWLALIVACCAMLAAESVLFRWESSRRSIRWRLSAAFLAMAGFVAAFVGVAIAVHFAVVERAAQLEAAHVAELIAEAATLENSGVTPNLQAYVVRLNSLRKRDVVIVDTGKKIVADVVPANVGEMFDHDLGNEIAKTISDGQNRVFIEESVDYPDGAYQIVVPLRQSASDLSNPPTGAVILEYTMIRKEFFAAERVGLYTIAAAGIVLVLLATFFGLGIARRIAQPLRALKSSVERIAAQDYEARVVVTSHDEIGLLGSSFNKMAEDLKASHTELVEHKRELEERVVRRTAQWQQAKAAAEESAAELTLLTDMMPISLSYVDSDRRFRYHNRVFAEWTDTQQIDGCAVADVLGPDVYAVVKDKIDQALAGRQVSYERSNRTRDGGARFIATHLMPRLRSDGEVVGFYSMSQDISERKDAEEALRHRNEELKQINLQLHEAHGQLLQAEKMASVGQLASGVAHEINNPVGYVYSNLSTLDRYLGSIFDLLDTYQAAERSIADETMRDEVQSAKRIADIDFVRADVLALLAESREGVTRVTKIVQDLKNFSRSAGDENWQWADIHQGIDSTLNIVWSELKYKAEVHKQYGELPQVQCRPCQLNQVFMNMLVNAAQAIKGHGTISIRTGMEGRDVWIEIADTGGGIKTENLTRIFDPFFTTKPVGKGTGLGLSVSYGIVKEHGGRIEVTSEIGRGTAFRVWLPVTQPTEAERVASPGNALDVAPATTAA